MRKPTSPFGAYKAPKPTKQPDPPAPRNFGWERLIMDAFEKRLQIEYRCTGDAQHRTMNPYVLYESGPGKVLVGGWQVRNPNKPSAPDWRNPEVGGLVDLRIGAEAFQPDPTFNTGDERYRNGVMGTVRRF